MLIRALLVWWAATRHVTSLVNGVKADSVVEDEADDSQVSASDRRGAERVPVTWSVDCETEDTFLYANITNISEVGIFVATREPLEVGTQLTMRFAPPGARESFVLLGQVQWVNSVK